MYNVKLDENQYFTGSYATTGSIQNAKVVDSLPDDLSNYKDTCYKWEDSIGWIFDDEKHKRILEEIANYVPPKTDRELIEELQKKNEELESALDELMTDILPEITGKSN